MLLHKIKFLLDNFKKEPFCCVCGQDDPKENEECSGSIKAGPIAEEEKEEFVTASPIDNFR